MLSRVADLLRPAANTNAESQATLPKSLQALLAKAEKALQPVRDARSQAEADSDKHTAKLPDALKSFVPLASEPEIKDASKGLYELELAVAHSPTSAAANEALQAKLDVLGECTRAKISERTTGQADLKPLIRMCQAVTAAGNKAFEIVYEGVDKVIKSGEGDGVEVYRTVIKALNEAAQKGGGGDAKQRDAAAQPATLLADAARAKPAFDVVVKAVSEASGAKLELAVLGQKDKHGNVQTGLKKTARMIEKAQLRPGPDRGKTERVCDVVRAMLVASDMATVAAIAEAFVLLSA